MAKVAFSKFGFKINQEVKIIQYKENFEIEIKQYLPVNEKLKLMGEVLEYSMDQNSFANPIKQKVFSTIAVIEYYTNITFTEKQKNDPSKLYDMINSSDLFNTIISNIPEAEMDELNRGIEGIVIAYYQYTNSILGILDNIKQNYNSKELDISQLLSEIKDPEAFEILKQIAPAMVGPKE